ncbi:hypothetical protein [Pengzhenrongella phosphoraccumulans]|uniref:hypothetical protein n=1 Tax=Pengzhenrongella phosphoraccumulans TaxID=3114394 RepID=UPI003890F25D
MSDAGRLAGFGVVLAAALGLGFGIGALVGPVETGGAPAVMHESSATAPGGPGAVETETVE